MITNADITVYNCHYNKDTRLDDWHRTVIRGVHFYVDNKVSVGDGGVNSADVYKIRIPTDAEFDSEYIDPEEYAALNDPKGYWTICNDDIVVQGVCSIDIEKPADLKISRKRYCKVTSWSDNRFGSSPHWRIGGV